MRRGLSSILAGVSLAFTPAMAAKPPSPPTGQWLVNFADSQCIASRDYGIAKQPVMLLFKEPALGDVIQVAVVKGGTGGDFAEQLNASYSLDGGRPMKISMIVIPAKSSKSLVFKMNMSREQFAALAGAQTISLESGARLDETFEVHQVSSVLNILDDCAADLRRVWNVADKDQAKSGANPKARGFSGVFTSEDYPGIALRRDEEGSVGVAVLVDETGKVADCSVVKTSGIAALDSQTCSVIVQRAHFLPAVGADGKPVKSGFVQHVTWRVAG